MRILKSGAVVFSMLLWFSAANATLVSWTISGPGTTAATENSPGDWDLTYYVNPAGFSTVTWTASATAATAGDYSFLWEYSGFHAYYDVTAFLRTTTGETLVNAGPANCCSSPSYSFDYSGGPVVFSNVNAGDTFGFYLGGSNFDINNILSGDLHLTQVPEPATLALFALGGLMLLGFGVRRTRA